MLKRVILAFLLSQPDTISPTPAISIGVCEGSFTINAHSVLYFLVVGCPEVIAVLSRFMHYRQLALPGWPILETR